MALRVVVCGDSRVEGYGNKQDFPQVPGPDVYNRTPYSTINGVVATVTPKAGAPGTGFACGVRRVNTGGSTGNIILFVQSRGSGYTANNMPTVAVSGGDGVPPNYFINPLAGGGIAQGLETYLNANGFAGAVVIDAGLDGQTAAGWSSADFYNALMAEGSAGDPANALIYMDIGVNDISGGGTAAQYHDNLLPVVNRWVADGYKVMISYPFGYGSLATTTQKAFNPAIQSLSTQIDNIIATNPAMIFKGVDNYSLFAANDAYFSGDGLHQIASGDTAINGLLGPRMVQMLTPAAAPPTTDPYKSDYTNAAFVEVNFKPNPPGSFTATGLGTALRPEGDLVYTVPANMQGGRIVFERRLHSSTDPWVAIGKVDGPDANTAPPAIYQDLTVTNGVTYEWRAYALPKGDFNPAVFP